MRKIVRKNVFKSFAGVIVAYAVIACAPSWLAPMVGAKANDDHQYYCALMTAMCGCAEC